MILMYFIEYKRQVNMNTENSIVKNVIEMFKEILDAQEQNIKISDTFEELEIDSILFIRLVVLSETKFEIEFEDEMLLMQKFPNVEVFANYIQKRYNEKHGIK